MRCPICKGTGQTTPDGEISVGHHPSHDRSASADACPACKGTGVCMSDLPWAVDAMPEVADALCADELLRSERQALILLLDYSLAFPVELTKQWRDTLQSIDLRGPDSGAPALAEIRSSFETVKRVLGASYREASAHDRRPYERECREIERSLIVLEAVVEHAASCLQEHPEMRRVSAAKEL